MDRTVIVGRLVLPLTIAVRNGQEVADGRMKISEDESIPVEIHRSAHADPLEGTVASLPFGVDDTHLVAVTGRLQQRRAVNEIGAETGYEEHVLVGSLKVLGNATEDWVGVNHSTLTGRLVGDLKLTESTGGVPHVRGRIAVEEHGQKSFINITAFGNGAKAAASTIGKGWLIAVDGRVRQSTWTDKDTKQKRTAISVVGDIEFLAAPRAQQPGARSREVNQAQAVEIAEGQAKEAARAVPADAPVPTLEPVPQVALAR